MLNSFLFNKYSYFLSYAVVVVSTSLCSELSSSDRLWNAIQKDDLAEVQTILHAHPEAIRCRETTYLHIAAQSNLLPVVEILVREGADVNAQDKYGQTPLHKAAHKGNTSITTFLLRHGAVVDTRMRSNTHHCSGPVVIYPRLSS